MHQKAQHRHKSASAKYKKSHKIHPHQNTQHIKAHNTPATKYTGNTQYSLTKIHSTIQYKDTETTKYKNEAEKYNNTLGLAKIGQNGPGM